MLMAPTPRSGGGSGGCAWLRHEQQTVAMALAEKLHRARAAGRGSHGRVRGCPSASPGGGVAGWRRRSGRHHRLQPPQGCAEEGGGGRRWAKGRLEREQRRQQAFWDSLAESERQRTRRGRRGRKGNFLVVAFAAALVDILVLVLSSSSSSSRSSWCFRFSSSTECSTFQLWHRDGYSSYCVSGGLAPLTLAPSALACTVVRTGLRAFLSLSGLQGTGSYFDSGGSCFTGFAEMDPSRKQSLFSGLHVAHCPK